MIPMKAEGLKPDVPEKADENPKSARKSDRKSGVCFISIVPGVVAFHKTFLQRFVGLKQSRIRCSWRLWCWKSKPGLVEVPEDVGGEVGGR